ncbi:MAG TPA: hypothetical protein PKZ76_12470, partial [Xanthomonadaceae bacterium]|nr:hypothetical protein [Xanthomonadaceae bacterium]
MANCDCAIDPEGAGVMKTILAILVSGWAALASAEQPLAEAPASAHPKCDSWAACEVVLRQLAVGSPYGVTGEQAAFAESLHRVAPDAWSEVAALAVDDDPGLRNLAGYAMGEWTPLTDDLIPEIVAALNRDPGGWPARALARLGTPAAIEAIIDEVVRYPRGGQGTWALTQVLPAALPQVLAALEVEENDHLVVGLSDALDSLVWLHTDTENRPSLWRATVVGMVEAATQP